MTIALALIGALVYGAADFFGGLASRSTATVGVVVWSQAAGLAVLVLLLPWLGGHPVVSDWVWGGICGLAGAAGVGFLYRGLAIGTMSVVSPVTAVLAAGVPVIFGVVVRGEHPSPIVYAGIAAALIAIVCVSAVPNEHAGTPSAAKRRSLLPPGVAEAVFSGIGFGAFFIALAQTRPDAGMYPLVAARLSSLSILTLAALVAGNGAGLRLQRPAVTTVVLCGVLDMSANVFYVLAAHGGMLAVVATLTSLYPAATVALAALILHERLGRVQWIGVAIALTGVVAISAAR